ncbi:MAG: glutamate 5-kinase [Spirochaeta sp. LUC14_002_19_P3]|nr:MAG: glutamate 5-kinase [Spirochaeta sp. LUC14_002_19_P3]
MGTNILAPGGVPDTARIDSLAVDIAALKSRGIMPILVSSGAIGFGVRALGLETRPHKVEMKQACAAIGQPELMRRWQSALGRGGLTAAQILLSREVFDDRKSFLNLKNAMESILELGVVPVINENDSVCTTEIGDVFGDNDSLSAHVASKLEAGLLIILTDIDALYDKDPRTHPEARPIRIVEKVSKEHYVSAGEPGSELGTGGMATKLHAAEIAARAGCRTVIADGREPGTLIRILDGEETGTLFLAGPRMGARSRWILSARSRGSIRVDEGAMAALGERKSLLARGIVGVDGAFEAGEVVSIGGDYKAVTSMSSEEIRAVQGRHGRSVKDVLGEGRREEVVSADDIVKEDSYGKTHQTR